MKKSQVFYHQVQNYLTLIRYSRSSDVFQNYRYDLLVALVQVWNWDCVHLADWAPAKILLIDVQFELKYKLFLHFVIYILAIKQLTIYLCS